MPLFLSYSRYTSNYKELCKNRLDDFLNYLAIETNSPAKEVNLEKIYETVNIRGETLFFSRLDVVLMEKYFHDSLHKSYNWLHQTRRALQSFFLYLNRKYDFPILTVEMKFNIDEHKQKPDKREKYIPTRHDLLKFLQSLLQKSNHLERDALFFLLLMTTGSRSSEILNTKIHEIDLINELIYKRQTKNKTSKFIVLREGFGEILQRYIEKFELEADDYLINNQGKKMSGNEWQEVFHLYLQDANLPPTTLHSLRHSFATIMAESGAEILLLQQLLKHKKTQSTKTYIDPNYIKNNNMELQINKEIYKHIKRN